MKLSEIPETSLFEPPPGLHFRRTGGSTIELDTSTPTAFEQFVTQTNAKYFDHCNIFLINNFCPSLTDKILKKDK